GVFVFPFYRFSIGENGDWEQEPPIHTKSSQAAHQVTALQPFTVYSFRVIAVNKLGHSHPSKESYYFVTLREAPTGKPVTTIAHNTSATSVYISWKAPPPESILGEFLGYRITYRPRDYHTDDVKEIYIRDSAVEVRTTKFDLPVPGCFAGASRDCLSVRSVHGENGVARKLSVPFNFSAPLVAGQFLLEQLNHEIHNLETYTQYLVSIQVFNPEGLGPPTTVLVMTDEGG
uniref:Fibronectin type-III domain-containing protein n=1 Tax=Anopheles minimus TaxID=112268 RepID=A0A182VRC0_9DIPT